MPTRIENFLVSKVGLTFQVFGAWRSIATLSVRIQWSDP